jgi:hypothetical protein
MPFRPQSHKTGDRAALAIAQICAECGWACDTFKSDYGEDILVQPDLNGKIDYCRIWIQSKGTRNISRYSRKEGDYSFGFSFEHALKWVRSSDLIVVVLWDVDQRTGFWSLPLYCIDEWNWYLLGQTKARMTFSKDHVLTVESMKWLGWKARVHHYTLLLNNALARDREARSVKETGRKINYKSRTPLIAFDFLRLIGVLTSDGVARDVLRGYNNAVRNLGQDDTETGAKVENMAAGLAVLRQIDALAPSVGLSGDMIDICAEITVRIIEQEKKRSS